MKKSTDTVNNGRRRILGYGLRGAAIAAGGPLLWGCSDNTPVDVSAGRPPAGPSDPQTPPPSPERCVPANLAQSPRGIHVSFTDDPVRTRTLTWYTDGLDDPGSQLEYGPVTPGMSAEGIACAPFPGRVDGSAEQAFGTNVLTHAATATGLDAGLPIRYRVGAPGRWSNVKVLAPTPQGPLRFCHFGDHGLKQASLAVLDGVRERNPDLLFIAGDLSYANGDQPQWDTWFDRLAPYASTLPVMTAPGNHEEEDNGGKAYRSRVRQPGQNTRYAMTYGNVHFVVSTGGSLLGNNVAQDLDLVAELAWLEIELAQAALRRAKGEIDFIILVQHFTIWTDQEGREPASPALVLFEEDKLLRYGVDLAMVGHDHIYQRSKPMGRGLPQENGYIQVTGGSGGVGLRGFAPISEWSAADAVRYCFTEYNVDGKRLTATTWAVDNEDNTLAGARLNAIDTFELRSRNSDERQLFARPGRSELLNADQTQAMLRHTRERNALHDSLEAISRRR